MIDCWCDYEPAQIYEQHIIKSARAKHACAECGRSILPGERYERTFGMWENQISVFKTCQDCLNIRQFVKNSVPCFCWAHGSMLDDAKEAIEAAYDRAWNEVKGLFMGYGRLVIAARRKRNATRETKL